MISTIARAIVRACIFHGKTRTSVLSSEKVWAPFDGGARIFDATDYFEFGVFLYQTFYSPYCAWAEPYVITFISLVVDAARLTGLG